ncbi:hypothetical protein BH09ACT1_BH09ACT1_02360 [soil metagenome]
MAPSTISVALGTRNGEEYVAEQVRSILDQTRLPTELIVSDDASSDGTIATIRSIFSAGGHPNAGRVGLTIVENAVALGVTANFAQAVSLCSGELIVLCDQDDVWDGSKLERQAAVFESRAGVDLVFTDASLIDGTGGSLGLGLFDALEVDRMIIAAMRGDGAFDVLLRRNVATGATIMFRRGLLAHVLPFPAEWLHDEWLAIICAATSSVEAIEDRLTSYRQHGSNEVGVREASIGVKIRRAVEPRGDRNARLVDRSMVLVSRLEDLGDAVAPRKLADARIKVEVESWRVALPSARLRRIAPILTADRRGWYEKYCSQGRLDMVRDLLQSHRPDPASTRKRVSE